MSSQFSRLVRVAASSLLIVGLSAVLPLVLIGSAAGAAFPGVTP